MVAFILLLTSLASSGFAIAQEPLPSWLDTAAKSRIINFVQASTSEGHEGYVTPDERIAVFDNDGTLWSEQPYYFQLGFIFDRVKTLAPQHPEWKSKEPYKSILKGDFKNILASGEKGLVDLVTTTHAGMTTDQFNTIVTNWFASARHPNTGKRYDEMTFLPMRELLDYLRANGFKTYIVSGGGVEFMRTMTESGTVTLT